MRKKSILLLEVFIWFLVLGGLIFLGISSAKNNFDARKTYEVVFKDVDGLIVGSPVRVMGLNSGYVTSVKPLKSEVYVTFVITDNQIKIPKGSLASVQFTGLAGSKSLEITPPETKSPSYALYAIEPVRVNSLIELQVKICQSILSASKNAVRILNYSGVENWEKSIKNAPETTKDAANRLEDHSKSLSGMNTALRKKSEEIRKNLDK